MTDASFSFAPVAVVKSCYKAKFGIPRQPGLVQEATGEIDFLPPFNQPNAVRGLENFSHVWVLFVFHQSIRPQWKATVRPPRLGGDKRIGVFASRSPFRPCPIGLSVLKLSNVVCKNTRVFLEVQGLDILDGTPVLDVKPYIPYCDSIPGAIGGYAQAAPDMHAIHATFTPEAEQQIGEIEAHGLPGFMALASKIVSADPRPAYQDEPGRSYGIFVHGYEIVWTAGDGEATVTQVRKAPKTHPAGGTNGCTLE